MTIKSPSQGDRWGIEVMLPKGGHETGALALGGPNRGPGTTPGTVLVLGTIVSSTAHGHPNDHAPFRTHVTSNHQYIPKLFLSSSLNQVSEDYVVRELQPCSELVTMSHKVESDEFALVLGGVACLRPEDQQRTLREPAIAWALYVDYLRL